MPVVVIEHWGRIPYRQAWERQRQLHASVVGGAPGKFVLCEHPPVYTLGRQTKNHHLLMERSHYAANGAEVIDIDRGGDVTYHGPGQIVGYPILRLADHPCGEDLHKYTRDVEEVLIRALTAFDLRGERVMGKTGVWVEGKKIASIGLKCSRWVTMHGFALNVATDMAAFGLVRPCGLDSADMSSLALLQGHAPERAALEHVIVAAFEQVFACTTHLAGHSDCMAITAKV